MSGDTLAITLFLVGTAVTLAVAAMSAAGWRHPYLIWALFAGSAMLALAGGTWWLLGPQLPKLHAYLSDITRNPVAWFVLIMVAVVAALWPRIYPKRVIIDLEQPAASDEITISSDALYVGNIQANTASLATEFFMEVHIQAFNGTRTSIAVTGMQGSITVGSSPAKGGSVAEVGKLPVPGLGKRYSP